MKKAKTVIIIILTLLVLIIVLQNTQPVETRLLFLTITMPKALLIIFTLLVGFAIGVIVASLLRAKPLPQKTAADKK
jgi:putative membrane protein